MCIIVSGEGARGSATELNPCAQEPTRSGGAGGGGDWGDGSCGGGSGGGYCGGGGGGESAAPAPSPHMPRGRVAKLLGLVALHFGAPMPKTPTQIKESRVSPLVRFCFLKQDVTFPSVSIRFWRSQDSGMIDILVRIPRFRVIR